MILEKRNHLCRKAWVKRCDYLQIDRFARIGESRYTIRNCKKNTSTKCTPETKPFQFLYITMINSIKNNDELKDLEEIEDLQSKVKRVRLAEKLNKQGFHHNVKEIFEPITKTVTNRN